MRLFVAVRFQENVTRAIADAIERFPLADPPWRWGRPETWHVTLKFLGETPENDVPAVCDCLETVCRAHAAFEMSLNRLGGFPNLERPRVLFFRVDDGKEALTRLAADVDVALADRMGLERDRRPFRAHATVARIKNRLPREVTASLTAAPVLSGAIQRVESVDLVQSRLTPKGARYTVVKGFALAGSS